MALCRTFSTWVANRLFSEVLLEQPDNIPVQANLGLIAFREGSYQRAVNYFEGIIDKGLVKPEMLELLALSYSALGLPEKAETSFKQALALDGELPTLHYHYGKFLHDLDRPRQAIPHYLDAIEKAPQLVECLSNLALAYIENGDPKQALSYLDRALAVNPDFH